jgi:hypothetical protein
MNDEDTPTEDTLPQWLYKRFKSGHWEDLSEDDQEYWRHEAEAVRRAVDRNGFKKEV